MNNNKIKPTKPAEDTSPNTKEIVSSVTFEVDRGEGVEVRHEKG